MDPVPIETIDEVRALHRLLFKKKFVDGAVDEFFGSPYIANVQRRLLAALVAQEPGWNEWADARQHDAALTLFAAHANASDWWQTADPESRRDYTTDCLAP